MTASLISVASARLESLGHGSLSFRPTCPDRRTGRQRAGGSGRRSGFDSSRRRGYRRSRGQRRSVTWRPVQRWQPGRPAPNRHDHTP